jgi:hypothetical protein
MKKAIDFLKMNWKPVVAGLVALLIIVILMSVGGKESASSASLKVAQKEGDVLFSANGAVGEFADVGTLISSGGALKTNPGAKAMLQTPEGGFIRLGENTELKVSSVTESNVLLTQNSGRTFHRVKKADDLNYEVSALGNTLKVTGTAFDLSVNPTEKRINVKVLEGEVTVTLANDVTAGPQLVAKGKEITVDTKGATTYTVADINTDYATSDWFTWNKEEDRKLGYELRFDVASAPVTAPEGAVAPTEPTTPTATAPKTTTKTSTTPKKSTPPAPATYTGGACKPSLSLKRGLQNLGIQLNWSTCKNSDFQFYKVVRSTTNPNLSYPSTPALVTSSNSFFGSYLDKNVAMNTTYYYRVCVVERTNPIGCSNVAKFTN